MAVIKFAYIATFLNLMAVCCADLNLFMNTTETQRLLGISAEMYYVRNNIINENALQYRIFLPANIDVFYLSWQNTGTTEQMWFNRSIQIDNSKAVRAKANLPTEGNVPNQISVFWVDLKCSRLYTGYFNVDIVIHVTLFSQSASRVLTIRRSKQCLKDYAEVKSNDKALNDSFATTADQQWYYFADWPPAALLFIIVMASTTCLLGLLIGVAFCLPKPKQRQTDATSSLLLTHDLQATALTNVDDTALHELDAVSEASDDVSTTERLRDVMQRLQLERSQVALGEVLMEGSFGKMYRGTLVIDHDDVSNNTMDVCIKTVTDAASDQQKLVFYKECFLLQGQFHQNINPLIATCVGDEQSPLLIFPYMNEGNLKKYLQLSKLSDRGTKQALTTQQLVYIATQLARGVEYLHEMHTVHCDIATRNCLIDSNLEVRLGDNALARDLFPADYHCLGDNENRPIKWLSLEAIEDNCYTNFSDVWAFGVTMWEIMTLALQPYADVDACEMDTYLREGYRVSQPPHCPDELFSVMACCWSLVPEERPAMAQLSTCLQDFYNALCQFI